MLDVGYVFALRRASEAPLLPLLLSAQMERRDPTRVTLRGRSVWGPLDVIELACLADCALAAVIRHRYGRETPMVTVSLTLALDRVCAEPDVAVHTRDDGPDGPYAAVLGTLDTSAGPLGTCMATFAVGRGRADAPPLPWEEAYDGIVPLADGEYTQDERDAARLLGAGRDDQGLEPRLIAHAGGVADGALRPGFLTLNRSGQVQGGVAAGLMSAVAVERCADPRRLLTLHASYLRPTWLEPTRVETDVVRAGRGSDVVRAVMSQGKPTIVADLTLVET